MTKYLVFTEAQFEAGIAEMASNMSHGGFLTRRAIGDPVAVLDTLPSAAPSPAPLDGLNADERWVLGESLRDFAETEDEAASDYKDSPDERAELRRRAAVARSLMQRIAAAQPAPLDVRLYGTPDDERLDCDPDEAVQSYLDGFCGEFPVAITLEEHDTYPPRVHFPSGDYAAEWCAEWSADNDTDEGFGDQAMDAAKDPAVVAAFDAAIDLLASKITYRMADKVTASYEVTIADESTWTYDPEFVSPLAAADREEPTA